MSEETVKSLNVERDGWTLSVVQRKSGTIVFSVEYRGYGSRAWMVDEDSTKRTLLANLEEAMDPGKIMMRMGPVRRIPKGMPAEWCINSEPDNAEFPFSLSISWVWKTGSFNQKNSGEILLAKEEVETLQKIFS